MIYLAALIFAVMVLFSSFPTRLCRANRVHLENNREPNAGIAFMPELITLVVIWLVATAVIKNVASTQTAWITLCVVSALFLLYNFTSSVISIRSYRRDYPDAD